MKKINIGRIKRYIKFGFESLNERQKGLDFTMRNLSAIKMSDGKYHGYAKTVEEHLHDVFQSLPIGEKDGILDIGCGKGTVLNCASQYPFSKICGIEIIPELVDTARRNIKRLGLEDRICCEHADAITYEHYDQFRFFYFFNPFTEKIFKIVLEKLLLSHERSPREIVIIYHNPTCRHLIDHSGVFQLTNVFYDRWKDYETLVFTINKKGHPAL